jgi:hypothetical protein
MLVLVAGAALASPAFAQSRPDLAQPDLKARCDQLISYYDRYGAGRSENSDGARNPTRMGAGIDCDQGRYNQGIAAMEALLRSKNFDVPPATGLAQTPGSATQSR